MSVLTKFFIVWPNRLWWILRNLLKETVNKGIFLFIKKNEFKCYFGEWCQNSQNSPAVRHISRESRESINVHLLRMKIKIKIEKWEYFKSKRIKFKGSSGFKGGLELYCRGLFNVSSKRRIFTAEFRWFAFWKKQREACNESEPKTRDSRVYRWFTHAHVTNLLIIYGHAEFICRPPQGSSALCPEGPFSRKPA